MTDGIPASPAWLRLGVLSMLLRAMTSRISGIAWCASTDGRPSLQGRARAAGPAARLPGSGGS
eukprot:1734593-Alexandrium_andersonii.AAC.1